jgi:hypothetical protein
VTDGGTRGLAAVRPLVKLGRVVCGECEAPMHPEEYQPVVGHIAHRRWLYWRCESGHVSEMLPLP